MTEVVVSCGDVATIRYMAGETAAPALPLYERVKREIALRGWTWTQLTKETKLARSTFNSWKTQPQPPQPRPVNAVADTLGIDRMEALKLAGILTELDPQPECDIERQLLARVRDAAPETSPAVIRVMFEGHRADRADTHPHCRPATGSDTETSARLRATA